MSTLTVSELITEDCLSARGIRYERIPQSHLPTPDYRLLVDPEPVIAEVKEFGPSGKRLDGGFYPVPFVQKKIKQCWPQLDPYRDHSCCVILYNQSSMKVFLEPQLILCAVFGDLFERVDNEAYRFSGDAATGPERNTGVSAVLGILPVRLHRNCIEAGRMEFKLTEGFSRELTDDEVHWIHQQTSESMGQVENAMRMVVVENPHATKALPENLFCGPLDERWAQGPDGIVRLKFAGGRIAEMKALLPEYYLKMMGIW
jgi:hypothetical protein